MLRSGPSPTRLYRLRLAIPIALALVVVAATAGAAATWTRVASPNRRRARSPRTSPPSPARRPRGRSATPTTATLPPTARWSSAPTGRRGASWPARAEAPAGTASSTVSTRPPPTTSGRSATTRSPATWSSATTAPPGRSPPPSRASRCEAWTWSGLTRRGSPATPARPPPSSTTPRAVEHAVHALRHRPAPAGARGGHRGPRRRRLGGRLGPELRRPRPAGLQPGRARTQRHMGTSGLAEPVQPQHPQRRGRAGQRRRRRGRGRSDGDRRRYHPALAHAALARRELVGAERPTGRARLDRPAPVGRGRVLRPPVRDRVLLLALQWHVRAPARPLDRRERRLRAGPPEPGAHGVGDGAAGGGAPAGRLGRSATPCPARTRPSSCAAPEADARPSGPRGPR